MRDNSNPPLSEYEIILINSSAGKDSQAMLSHVVSLSDIEGVKDRLTVVHCDLGRVEWKGTRELAEQQAKHYDLRFEVVSRPQGDLLDHVASRGMWPGPATRYCTSDHKRGQVRRVITKLVDEVRNSSGRHPVRILNCMGLRADESPSRAKRRPFERDNKASNGRRIVDTWLPIHSWTEAEVWRTIVDSGVPHHYAYDLGMPRLSCCFCIFAPRPALLLAGHHNPELLDEYVRIEQAIDHTFRQDVTLIQIKETLASGYEPKPVREWMKCS